MDSMLSKKKSCNGSDKFLIKSDDDIETIKPLIVQAIC